MAALFLVFGRSLTPPNADAPPAFVALFLCRDFRAGGVAASQSLQIEPGRKAHGFSAPVAPHVAQEEPKSKPLGSHSVRPEPVEGLLCLRAGEGAGFDKLSPNGDGRLAGGAEQVPSH